jgi:hypothetical protein
MPAGDSEACLLHARFRRLTEVFNRSCEKRVDKSVGFVFKSFKISTFGNLPIFGPN